MTDLTAYGVTNYAELAEKAVEIVRPWLRQEAFDLAADLDKAGCGEMADHIRARWAD